MGRIIELQSMGVGLIGPATNSDKQLLRFYGADSGKVQVAPLACIGDDGHMSLGQVAAPCSMFELWDDDAHPILSITAAHADAYDPQIQFRTDATDTIKCSLGVDSGDSDKFKIYMGEGIGGTSQFIFDSSGQLGIGKTPGYQLDLSKNLNIPTTSDATTGVIFQSGTRFMHSYGRLNIFMGPRAGNFTTTGSGGNVAVGSQALESVTTGMSNFALGERALSSLTTSSHNVAIGATAGRDLVDGISNVLIGRATGLILTNQSENIFIGRNVGIANTGNNNTAIGAFSFNNSTSAYHNTIIGRKAGDNITTGDRNIIIGYDVDAISATASDQLNIGNLIYGDLSNSIVGINEPNPETFLELTSAAPYTTWHNSTEEDIDGGRESILWFSGEQSGGEETHLGSMTVAHDGAADDQKAYIAWATNGGADGDAPTERMRLDSAGLASFAGDINIANGKVFKVNSAQVVAAQQAHIVDADGTLASVTAQFNTLLSYLDADAGHGLLAGA